MSRLQQFAAIAVAVLAAAIVFSPLAAALIGTGMNGDVLAAAFQTAGRPLAESIGTAIVAAGFALSLGVPFALLVDRSGPRLRRVLWTAGLLTLMVPPYLAGEALIVLLGPAGYLSRGTAILLGFGPHSIDPTELARFQVGAFVYTWPAAGLVMGGCFFSIVALAVSSAYRRTDQRMFESARLAQGRRGVWKIAARLLLPPAVGASLLVFAVALTEFAVPQLLRVRTIGEAIYEQIQEGDIATAAALCLPLLPIVLSAGAIGAFVLRRSRTASMAGLEGEVPKFTGPPPTRSANIFASLMAAIAITPGLVLPMLSLAWLLAAAKLPAESAMGTHKLLRASGFFDSLNGAWDLAHDDAVRTIVLATFAATLATAFAILLARLVSKTRWGSLLGGLGAGLAVPAPIVGLGLIALWNRGAGVVVYQSLAIVVLAWFARFLPIGIFLAQAALARVPRELESAAALAGRKPFERLITIVLPNAAPGLVAAWLATYVLCATEFSATLLIAPPGGPLLAPSVVNLMRRGQDPEIAACQVLLLAVVVLPLLVIAPAALFRARRWAFSKELT